MEPLNLYTIITLSATMVVVLYVLLNFTLKIKSFRYDEEKKRIELEIMRRTLEEKVYRDTDRLTSNSERWAQVNHLLMEVLSQSEDSRKKRGQRVVQNDFLSASGVDLENLESDRKKVFVLTPFHPRYESTFRIISSACQDVGFKCSRGDEQFIRGGVLGHILQELASAGIIIANIDGRNPNVFYELGIAHALGKDVILVASGVQDVPFDLKSQRLIVWKKPAELERALHQTLTRLLAES
ncbi:MAG: hypothetical protein AB7E15_13045 [Azospira sp.]|jgi:hypothetical protein